jgi:hypothetical protein
MMKQIRDRNTDIIVRVHVFLILIAMVKWFTRDNSNTADVVSTAPLRRDDRRLHQIE